METKKILKFQAEWCGPCKSFHTTLTKVLGDEKYQDIELKEVDIDSDNDEDLELVNEYKVRNIPTTLFLDKDENLLKKVVGNISESELKSILDE